MSDGGEKERLLKAEGWTRQFIASEPRLSEAAEMYRDLGFEVLLESLPEGPECTTCEGAEEGKDQCMACFRGHEDQYKIIYTRPLRGHEDTKTPGSPCVPS